MKKTIILLVAFAVVSGWFISCKADKNENKDIEWQIVEWAGENKYQATKEYSIMGLVECSSCRPYDIMMVWVENKEGVVYPGIPPWEGTFEQKAFKLPDYLFYPEMEIHVRVSIGLKSEVAEVEVPVENEEPIKANVSFDD